MPVVFDRGAALQNQPEAGKGTQHALEVPPRSGHRALHGENSQVERTQMVVNDKLFLHDFEYIFEQVLRI